MPRLGIWLITITTLLVLAVVAIWQVPQHLDWTRYRSTIETLASNTLGQPVSIGGPIKVTLFPQPMVTAAQVSIGNDAAAGASIHVEALRLRVAPWPLLAGRIDARELVLQAPDLRIPWPLAGDLPRADAPTWLAAFNTRIENGRLTLGEVVFSGIDAVMQSSEGGSLNASGSARFNGQDWHFIMRATPAGADGSIGLEVALDGLGKAGGLGTTLIGRIAADGGFAGTLNARGPNLALLLPAPAVPFSANGRLTIAGGLAAVDELTLQIGGSPARGAVALRVLPEQRLDIALEAGRLDLDAWLPALRAAQASVAGVGLPIGIDVSADAAPFGGGTLERVRATVELTASDLVVHDASAVLPGNAQLRLSGRLTQRSSAQPAFAGEVKLRLPVLRTTLRWLQAAVPNLLPVGSPPDGVMQRADVSAQVLATDGAITLQQLVGTVDDSQVTGSVAIKHAARPAIVAEVSVDRLALDAWLPIWPMANAADAALRLDIAAASLAGHALHDVAIDADMEAGTLALRGASAIVDGAAISASGVLHADGQLSDGVLSLHSQDATPLADMLPRYWRATPAFWQGPLTLSLHASGPPTALALGIKLSLADATLEASSTADVQRGQWSGQLTLRHPGARRLASAIGLQIVMPWLDDGSLSLTAHVSGTGSRLAADNFNLTAGGMRLSGDFSLNQTDNEPHLSGTLTADSLVLPMPSGSSNVPLPIDMLRGWQGQFAVSVGRLFVGSSAAIQNAAARIEVADGALHVDRFAGKLDGGTLTGNAVFNGAATPPSLAVQARLDGATVATPLGAPIDLTSAAVGGTVDVSASGYSAATLLATLTGHVAMTATNGTISGFDLAHVKTAAEQTDPTAAEKAASDAIGSGTTTFDRIEITGSLAHGDLLLDAANMRGDAGEAEASGDISFPGQSLDLRFVLQPAMDSPPRITVRLSGPLDHPQRTPELASVARFVAEHVH